MCAELTALWSLAQLEHLRETFAAHDASLLRTRVFRNQGKGFAFSYITDEDAATQAIAEVLDWLVAHLHRFRTAAGTSDGDPWCVAHCCCCCCSCWYGRLMRVWHMMPTDRWPQGRNGPFFNVGLKTWQDTRTQWIAETQPRYASVLVGCMRSTVS